jgi:hypothetical protein
MLAVKLLGAEDIAQSANVSILNLLPGVDDLSAALIHKSEVQDSLQIVHGVRLHVVGLVANGLVSERARLVIDVDLLTVEWNQVDVVFNLWGQL